MSTREISGRNIVSKETEDLISIEAPAKLNLTLEITGVLPNGYHTVKTVMIPVTLTDTVTVGIVEKKGVEIQTNSSEIPLDHLNLSTIAAEHFFRYTGEERVGLLIYIDKIIPVEAGLAGGSANAAATIKALNLLFDTKLSLTQMEQIGMKIGADVPFCIRGKSVVASGFGEKLRTIKPLEDGYFVIIKEKNSFSKTESAFMELANEELDKKQNHDAVVKHLAENNIKGIGENLSNVFESIINTENTAKIKTKLIQNGALGASMTGAGTAVFGIFDDAIKAKKAKNSFAKGEYDSFLAMPIF